MKLKLKLNLKITTAAIITVFSLITASITLISLLMPVIIKKNQKSIEGQKNR